MQMLEVVGDRHAWRFGRGFTGRGLSGWFLVSGSLSRENLNGWALVSRFRSKAEGNDVFQANKSSGSAMFWDTLNGCTGVSGYCRVCRGPFTIDVTFLLYEKETRDNSEKNYVGLCRPIP